MGFPDNRDIEPTRDDLADFNNQPDFMIMHHENDDVNSPNDDNSPIDEYHYLRLQTFIENGDEMPAEDSDSDSSDSDHEAENEFIFDNIPTTTSDEPPADLLAIRPENLQAQVWNTPRSSHDTIELSNEKSQQIQLIMSKFSLKNVPPAYISDVQDVRELLARIKNKPSTPVDKKN